MASETEKESKKCEEEPFDVVEVCDKKVLFSNNRIKREELPDGVYKYELRYGDEGNFCSLEKSVVVNFGGTILTKEPLDLGEDNYLSFDEESDPNFLGEEMTLGEYLGQSEEAIVAGISLKLI